MPVRSYLTHPDPCPCCARREAVADMYVAMVAEAELDAREARADLLVYRAIAQAALDVARHATVERDRLTERLRHVLDQRQALRAHDRRAA